MKVLQATIDWMLDWDNDPHLKVLVDKIPDKVIYHQYDLDSGAAFYVGENDGWVSYFYHNPMNQTGFGGRNFTLTLDTGEVKVIKGPWSSRAGVANHYLKIPCVDVTITDEFEVWQRGFTFYAGSISVAKISTYLNTTCQYWELRKEIKHNELTFRPVAEYHLRERFLKKFGFEDLL